MSPIPVLSRGNLDFPKLDNALRHPNGLIAAGGDLSTDRLIAAYSQGIFPWYEEGRPILWWSPDPRAVMFPDQFRISRSLGRLLRQNRFEVTLNTDFDAVIKACSGIRKNSSGAWITPEMKDAYMALHRIGVAHSVECHLEGKLAGGLYGIGLGRLFFGESMFYHEQNASKVAFAHLASLLKAQKCPLIDCQISNPHLQSLGATSISRERYAEYLDRYITPSEAIDWHGLPTRLPPWYGYHE